MLRFLFSFTKATKSFGILFVISQSVDKMCQDLLCVQLGGKGDCCDGTGLGLGALALWEGVRESTWVIPRAWDEALPKQRMIAGLRCLVQNSSHALVAEGTQRNLVTVWGKVLLRDTSGVRDLCDSYFPAQACIQNNDSAPNTADNRNFSRALQRWVKSPHSNQQIPGQKSPLPSRKLRTNTTWQMMKPFRKAWFWSNIKIISSHFV